jgi:hypothetical protein
MIKQALITFFFLAIGIQLSAQSLTKAPKNYAIELGYRHIPSTTFDIKTGGVTVLFDYAWQLSGFNNKPASFISVPLGYTYLFQGNSNNTARILSYGWTVRHHLTSDRKAIPFIGYGLLLNQLRMSHLDGSVFGHQTRFDFGYMFRMNERLRLFAKFEYSYTRFPRLGMKNSDKIHAAELKVGINWK